MTVFDFFTSLYMSNLLQMARVGSPKMENGGLRNDSVNKKGLSVTTNYKLDKLPHVYSSFETPDVVDTFFMS